MCTISIDPNSINGVPLVLGGTQISVSGTVANCASQNVQVTIDCGPGASTAPAVVSGNTWTATVDTRCVCGSRIWITATCQDPNPCTDRYNTILPCRHCCPQVSTTVNQGLWNSSGQQLVTFVTTLNFPAGCPVTVQRDFGDTTFGVTQTFTSSPATYTETHAYTTGSGYTSNLNVLSNPTCGTSSASVTTSSAPSCATKSLCQALCKLFQFLFLLFGSAALVSLVATTSPACIVINSSLPAVATGFAITAGASLLILYLACRKCVCGFWRKLLGQLLTNVGAILFMFVLPLNCTQPVPFALPFYAFGAALLCLLVGASFVLYNLWFGFLRNQCPLTICDYWQAIKDALTVAILSAVLVYVSMGLGATIVHLGLALLVISLLLILSNQEILINQNANKC